MRSFRYVAPTAALLLLPGALFAADIVGTATDLTGGALAAARVTVTAMDTGRRVATLSDAAGRFSLEGLTAGTHQVVVSLGGFSDHVRTVSLESPEARVEVHVRLQLDGLQEAVNVTATRNERDAQLVPLRTDSLTAEGLEYKAPASTGAALLLAPGITPVGSGPMLERPRLRGLDSTRLLVLVDGERLNNARTATDRAGVEVSLVDLFSVQAIEVVGGSGSVLYGTDALAGTINIMTNQPTFSGAPRLTYGFDGSYSSNENGRRGTVTVGARTRRLSFHLLGTLERYDDYRAGGHAGEDTRPLFADGTLRQVDTVDEAFGFTFRAFPDPFNAPFVRTSSTIPTSGASGSAINAAALVALTTNQTLQVKYLNRRMAGVGFPDFQAPVFFSRVTLPFSHFDRVSIRYEARALAPWLTSLRASTYYQAQRRLVRNEFPVQFPAPTARVFFPVNVFRLDIASDTEQHVRTPGVDLQATMVFARRHVVTAGAMLYQDRSADSRTTTTRTSLIGNVALGPRGPQAEVFSTPIAAGPPSVTHPTRVPDATFGDVGLFVQDEWEIRPALRVVAGLRVDRYAVETEATPGYEVDSVVAGARPAINPASLPVPTGDRIRRHAVTGDIGLVARVTDRVSLLARYGRSYRHANLEELLFAGPATVGAIAPNLLVEPETGHNIDVGIKLRTGRYSGSLSYFRNSYDGFISTEIVAAGPGGPLSQAVNFSDVRIQGLEAGGQAPVTMAYGSLTLFGTAAFTRGDVRAGVNPLTGVSLAGTPQDNISPLKAQLGLRFSDTGNRFWAEYAARVQTDVTRVATTLVDSPYLIAQDLLSLDGFAVHRLAAGLNVRGSSGRLGIVLAVDNLTDRFYREHFQFAPSRGRTVTLGLHVRGL